MTPKTKIGKKLTMSESVSKVIRVEFSLTV